MAGISMCALMTLLCIVTVTLGQTEPNNRRYPNKKQHGRFQQNRRIVNPSKYKGEALSKYNSDAKQTQNEHRILSKFNTKYEERNDVEYTAHGVDRILDLGNLTRDARSKHGCMTIMKRTNKDRYNKMSYAAMEISCVMYTEWGKNMRQKSKWEPTQGQQQWLNSLGVKEKMKRMYAHEYDRRTARQSGSGRAIRKEFRMLTDQERRAFQEAVQQMKNTYMDGSSKYDLFVKFHQANAAPSAHFGPGFLGYHRELLVRFENALREINPTVSLPYWDSNLDKHLGDDLAQVSVLWTDEFLGNGKGDVTIGPFAHWTLINPVEGKWLLHRNLTVAPPSARTEPALMSDEAVELVTNARTMRDISWFVDVTFESHHGAVHNWIGGVMGDLPNSPSDPVFFMHHAFIDCLWEQMRSRQRQRVPTIDPRYDYPNDSFAFGVGIIQPDGEILTSARNSYHYATNTMEPFGPLKNIDGLRNEYFEEFYTCASSPRCSANNLECGSPYLFCDRDTFRCAPKLNIGSSCVDFVQSDPCNKGVCCEGTCRTSCSDLRDYSGPRRKSNGDGPDESFRDRDVDRKGLSPSDKLQESVDTASIVGINPRLDIPKGLTNNEDIPRTVRQPFTPISPDRINRRSRPLSEEDHAQIRDPRPGFRRPNLEEKPDSVNRNVRSDTRPVTEPTFSRPTERRVPLDRSDRRPQDNREIARRYVEPRQIGRQIREQSLPDRVRKPIYRPSDEPFFDFDRFFPDSERRRASEYEEFDPFQGFFGSRFRLFR